MDRGGDPGPFVAAEPTPFLGARQSGSGRRGRWLAEGRSFPGRRNDLAGLRRSPVPWRHMLSRTMNTPHVTIRLGASSAALIDPPQDVDVDAVLSDAGGRKRHDTPFSFDIVFEPSDDGTPQAERGGKWRVHIPFTFELAGSEPQTVDVRIGEQRSAVALSLERRVPPTDGGLMLAALRETVGITVEVPVVLDTAARRARMHTSFSFDVSSLDRDHGHITAEVILMR